MDVKLTKKKRVKILQFDSQNELMNKLFSVWEVYLMMKKRILKY